MKKKSIGFIALAIAAATLFSFDPLQTGSIRGEVAPAGAGVRVWAITGADTVFTNLTGSAFQISDARPGVYRLIVEAKAPYKHMVKDSVVVSEGKITDVGVITLQQ